MGSAGSISILSSSWRPAIRSTGRASTRPGTISAPSAIPPISRNITGWTATAMRRRGRSSMSPVRRATAPAHGMWRGRRQGPPTPEEPSKGLMVQLKDRDDTAWVMDHTPGAPSARHPSRRDSRSKRVPAVMPGAASSTSRYMHGRPLMDTHRPALLEEGLYYADGQIQDEVYEYGSFLQSKMYRAGVTCNDCHDPHSLRLRDTGNALCARCHLPERFDTPAHHFHYPGSAGSQCVVSYADQDLHGCGCPAGSQLAPAAAGSFGAARDAQRVYRLPHGSPAAVGC